MNLKYKKSLDTLEDNECMHVSYIEATLLYFIFVTNLTLTRYIQVKYSLI